MPMRKISKYLLQIYALIIAYIMFKSGEPGSPSWYILAIPFFLLVISPQWALIRKIDSSLTNSMKKFWFALQVTFFTVSLVAYYDALFVNVDPQSGLVFLVFPILQYVIFFVLLQVIAIINFIKDRKRRL